jgi:hypothetical protein
MFVVGIDFFYLLSAGSVLHTSHVVTPVMQAVILPM